MRAREPFVSHLAAARCMANRGYRGFLQGAATKQQTFSRGVRNREQCSLQPTKPSSHHRPASGGNRCVNQTTRRFLLGQRASKGLQGANLLISLQAIWTRQINTGEVGASEIETSDGRGPKISDGPPPIDVSARNILYTRAINPVPRCREAGYRHSDFYRVFQFARSSRQCRPILRSQMWRPARLSLRHTMSSTWLPTCAFSMHRQIMQIGAKSRALCSMLIRSLSRIARAVLSTLI
ncbi:hypothetical protein ACVILL_000978 [Bradyrhizobium sp. USDA 3364]